MDNRYLRKLWPTQVLVRKLLLTPAQRMSHRRNRFLAGGSELLAVARVPWKRRRQ